jgi:hypothetical protein
VALREKRSSLFGDGYGIVVDASQERMQSALDWPRIHQTVEIARSELSSLMLTTRAAPHAPPIRTSVSSSPQSNGRGLFGRRPAA